MELDKISMFISVAENRSFSDAAKACYKSHSTMSRTVTSLENELGVELIIRESNRFVELTDAGILLYNEGKHLLEQEKALSEKLKEFSND